jgi:hypothetical protein
MYFVFLCLAVVKHFNKLIIIVFVVIPRLDALQLLMLFAGTLTYLEPKLFFLSRILCWFFLIIKILIALSMNACIYIFLAA